MSEQQQINKLRAQMSALKSNIEELNQELKKSDETITDISIERDLYYKQLLEAQMTVKNIDQKINDQVESKIHEYQKDHKEVIKKKAELEEENGMLKNRNKIQQQELDEHKALYNKTIEDNRLLMNKAKGDPKQYTDYIMQFKDTRQQAMAQLNETNRRMNKLQVDMENILAENRVLRKLAGVPENYGFDLEEIKSSEKNKIEDFMSQVRYLEREVEELEKERTQLRARLRDALTKQGKGEEGLKIQKGDEYMRTNKDLRDQVEKLTKQLEMQGYGGDNVDERKYMAQQNDQTLKTLKEFQDEMKKNIEQLLNGQNNANNAQNANLPNQSLDDEKKYIAQKDQVKQIIPNFGQFNNHGMPPEALPGPMGNMSDIREGYSNKFQQKMPVDMYEMYGESGFDQVQAKHEIAQLQLMNIELVKTLTNKTSEYTQLSSEIEKVREDLKISLLIQDELFDQHYKKKQELLQDIKSLQEEKGQVEDSLSLLQKKYDILEQFRKNIENDSKDTLEDKLAQMSKRTAILDVNMIKLARKYQAVLDENTELSELVKDQESDYIERERQMKQKILELEKWKRTGKTQLKLLLENAKKSITIHEYNTMVDMEQIRNEQIAQLKLKLGSCESEIAKFSRAERSLQDCQDSYRLLQEELVEINLEFDLTKRRLEDMDPAYRKFQQFFKKLVDFFKTCQDSPLSVFQSIDENTDGKIGKTEFENLIKRVGVHLDSSELEVVFKFMDTDGSDTIEYKEFLKKLRRAGINIRNENEQQIFNLYEHLKKAQLSLKEAFDLFDPDRSNTITRKEMEQAFQQVHIQVTPQTIDYVFKMADVSGEGQITFDEWRSLFENIIKDSIREDEQVFSTKLDWKKEVMIKLDEGLRDANFQLIDLFKFMELDVDQQIGIEEFRKLFYNLKVQIEPQEVQQLFSDIDKDDSHEIDYNELLNYIREARRDQERVQRQIEIQKRAERINLNEENIIIHQMDENNPQNKMAHIQGQLQMKLATLELREKNTQKRNEHLRKELNNGAKMQGRDKERINELETEQLNSIQNYYKERDERIKLQRLLENCETKDKCVELNKINEKMQLERAELQGALGTFKNLYKIAIEQCQVYKYSLEKRKHEKENLREAIKELQSQGDDKALMGKLFHQIMYSKWEKSEIGKKHEKLWEEYQQIKIDIANRDREIERQERENNIIHVELDERVQKYEREIANLKGKIIPTVNINKIEELYNKMGEITQLKLDLEITNKKMRQENYEITLKCDYYETNQKGIQDLEKKLKSSYTDDIQIKLIDQSKEISNLKMSEMRALREAMMAKEKEEYYQRVNRQNTEILKNLENQVAEHQLRFTERENYWRNRCSQLLKSLSASSDQVNALKTSEEEITQNLKNKKQEMNSRNAKEISFKKGEEKQEIIQKEKDIDFSQQNAANNLLIEKMKKQVEILTQMLTEREQEIKEIKLLMDPELLKQHRSQRQESVQDAMKKVIDEEGHKMAQMAQKTITTLQNLIEEKNEQLARKDRLIDKMRKDFMEDKQRDVDEIRRLTNQAISANMTANEKMRASFIANDGKHVMQNEEYWGEVGKVLQEKDVEIQKLKDNFDGRMQEFKKSKKIIDQLQKEIKSLEYQLEEARGAADKSKGPELNSKALQNLVKLKDKEINSFKSSLQQLKDEFIKQTVSSQEKEEELVIKYAKVKAENNELKKIQDKLSKDVQTSNQVVQKMQKDKFENNNDLKLIELRGTVTELEDKLKKAGISVDEKPNSKKSTQQKIGDFFDSDLDTKGLKAKIAELEKENIDLNQAMRKITQKTGGDLIDVNGFLQAKGMYFASFQEICDTIRQWIKLNPSYSNLMVELKKEDKTLLKVKKEKGMVPESKFYEILKIHRILLKEQDIQKLNKELIDSDKNMDIVKFCYHINGYNEDQKLTLIKHAGTECKVSQDQSVGDSSQREMVKKQVDFELKEEKDQFTKTQQKGDPADMTELELSLNKKISIQSSRMRELSKDKTMNEKQMNEWRDKYYKLERDSQEMLNKTNSSKQPPIQKQASGITAMTMDLKDIIFQLEDSKVTLEEELKKKDRDLKRLEDDKKKLMDDIKAHKSETLKQKQKLDDIIKDKIGREQLLGEHKRDSDKDSIIIKLKKNLESNREKEDQMTEQLYALKIKNEDLEEIKNKYDQQIDRLIRRIADLDEFRKSQGQGGEQKGPFKTLKKPIKK